MTYEQLMSKRQINDVPVVARMIGESNNYTAQLLRRKNAKKHKKAIEALEIVIKAREDALKLNHSFKNLKH